MQFYCATVHIQNMERSLQFYRDLLGLTLQQRHPIQNGELAFLGREGQPMVELICAEGEEAPAYAGFSLGFRVDSLDEASAKMEAAGFPIGHGPISPAPGTRFSFLKDPDGIEIELIEMA